MAEKMISSFVKPKGMKINVLFDSYYLTKNIVKCCENKGFYYIGTIKNNRNITVRNRRRKTGEFGKSFFQRTKNKSKCVLMRSSGKVVYTIADAGIINVAKLGNVRFVLPRRKNDTRKLAVVTNDTSLTPGEIVRAYSIRWNIEVFFKDAKQLLGMGQYKNLSHQAAVIHLHLVCFAQALLTHIAVSQCAKSKAITTQKQTTEMLQNTLRKFVWNDTTDELKRFKNPNNLIREMGRLLIAA